MAIPDFQSLMLPLLEFAGDGQEHSSRDAREHLAGVFSLSASERAELLPSGRQPVFDNRVAWAKTFLQQAGLLFSPRRAYFQITERGRQILAEPSGSERMIQLNIEFLSCGADPCVSDFHSHGDLLCRCDVP
jgi:restriction system protein